MASFLEKAQLAYFWGKIKDFVTGQISPVQSDVADLQSLLGETKRASGNPATFYTEKPNGNFTRLMVSMEPVQSGSGDPSPTNVRPITGFTGVSLSVSDGDGGTPTVYAVAFPANAGTVAMGTLDLVSGELTVTHISETFDGSSDEAVLWTAIDSNKNRGSIRLDKAITGQGYTQFTASNILTPVGYASGSPVLYKGDINSGGYLLFGIPTTVTSAAELRTWLAANNLQVVYPIAEPQTYSLTVPQIKALMGTNSLSVNDGATIDLTYTAGLAEEVAAIQQTMPIIKIGTAEPTTATLNPGEIYLKLQS